MSVFKISFPVLLSVCKPYKVIERRHIEHPHIFSLYQYNWQPQPGECYDPVVFPCFNVFKRALSSSVADVGYGVFMMIIILIFCYLSYTSYANLCQGVQANATGS